jgi:hypothetical protein
MLKGGSKERKNERTNGRTNGGKPGRRRWSEGKPRSRSIDRCDANRESRFVHIEKSSIIIRFPLPTSRSFHPSRFVPSRAVPLVPSVSAFHDHRSLPPCVVHPRHRASSSSSSRILVVVVRSAVVASHAPERECSSCGFVRVAMSRPNPGARRGNSVRSGRLSSGRGSGSLFRFSGSSPVDFDDERKKKTHTADRSIACRVRARREREERYENLW